MSKRHHTIISGTGRAGTTFLMELLTRLGLETGFRPDAMPIDGRAFAGLERDIRDPSTPYIAKAPQYVKYLPRLLSEGSVVIDHAIIPIRDFEAAANSRARVTELARVDGKRRRGGGRRPRGGLWLTDDPGQQINVLYQQFSILMETLARHDVPVTFLWYPRLTRDANYTFAKLRFLMPALSFETFESTFATTVRPDRVHQLSQTDA